MSHRSTGPLTSEELKELASEPFGAGLKAIRKHDPLYGRKEGERFKWRVTLSARAWADATVMAADEEDARREAELLDESEIEYKEFGNHVVESVEPEPE